MAWVIKKSSGILCSKRLPSDELIRDSIDYLKILNNNNIKDEKIPETIIPALRNVQSLLLCNIDVLSTNLFLKTTKKFEKIFIELLKNNLIKNNELLKDMVGQLKRLNRLACADTAEINRQLQIVIGVIDKYIESYKNKETHYTHSFMNDYNRITYSSAFRRLQDKAQVFPLEKYDYARTRLTHSIEVSSIASQLGNLCGQAICSMDGFEKKNIAFQFEKCLLCSALLHDIGNPPFGHFGEEVIKSFFSKKWNDLKAMDFDSSTINSYNYFIVSDHKDNLNYEQMKDDFVCFDGNAQSFRIASKVQRYKQGHSLELTAAVLGSIIKYPVNSLLGKVKEKFGYFYSERKIVNLLSKLKTFDEKFRNPLAVLMEAADDISYVTSDLDDAVKKVAISYEEFVLELDEIKDDTDSSIINFKNKFKEYYSENKLINHISPFEYTINRMTNDLRIELIRQTVEVFCNNLEIIKNGLFYLDKTDINKFNIPFDDFNNHLLLAEFNELLQIIKLAPLVKWIKDNLFKKHIYLDRVVISNELSGNKILSILLECFVDAVLNLDFSLDDNDNFKLANAKKFGKCFFKQAKVFSLLSKNFVDLFKKETQGIPVNSIEHIYLRLHLVVDHISGMTDSYAKETYQALQGF